MDGVVLQNGAVGDKRPLRLFLRLMRSGRFAEAFAAGERVLASPSLADLRSMGQLSPPSKAVAGLERLAGGRHGRWARFYLARLRPSEADARAASAGAPPRFAWMAYWLALSRLDAGDAAGALRLLAWARKQKPADWWPHSLGAELSLCAGDAAQARRWARSGRAAAAEDPGNFLAWAAFFELWQGRTRRARAGFLAAEKLGAWEAKRGLGACALLLGRPAEALKLLEEAEKSESPAEDETLAWLAEAERLCGRPRAALARLKGRKGFWASVNRALACKELGDVAGLERERAALPGELRDVERAPARAKGFRRDMYGQRIWLRAGKG